MYESQKTQQLTFQGFNQSCGTPLNQDDEWVVLADRIDWRAVELEYQQSFKSGRGRPGFWSLDYSEADGAERPRTYQRNRPQRFLPVFHRT